MILKSRIKTFRFRFSIFAFVTFVPEYFVLDVASENRELGNLLDRIWNRISGRIFWFDISVLKPVRGVVEELVLTFVSEKLVRFWFRRIGDFFDPIQDWEIFRCFVFRSPDESDEWIRVESFVGVVLKWKVILILIVILILDISKLLFLQQIKVQLSNYYIW